MTMSFVESAVENDFNMSTKDVAHMFGVSIQTVGRWAKKEWLQCITDFDGSYLFSRRAVCCRYAQIRTHTLTANQVAKLLGVSRGWVYELVDSYKLPSRRNPGGEHLFSPEDVEAYKASLAS